MDESEVCVVETKEEIIKRLGRLHNEIEVVEAQNSLKKRKCKICSELGADILSFEARGPAHQTCLLRLSKTSGS
jgi:hypothetical protein